ncbi:2TM domain-containing protein [Leptothermofonsia sp. ETS-13]|uniref:2TM domain-containing protein n=1 Tax=Leptothermofonsia sp. ETS-13 TaxID=3035696 RepID=UPI003B9F52DB
MPPRWPRKPDRQDSAYRRLDDRMNFAVHVAIFAVINSGLWFFRILGETSELGAPGGLPWTPWITAGWGAVLVAHAIFIFAIAKYEDSVSTANTVSGTGFQPKSDKKTTKTKR